MERKNEDRFSNKADFYKKFRPTYPKELIDYLYSQVGFTQKTVVADIGSGTGIFSRLLIEQGSFVYCVEPNEDMRLTVEEDLSEFENFASVNGNDKNTNLTDASVDFITVAQAIHWFDRQAFKSECQRILKPTGKVVLVWNERDYETEIIKKDYALRAKYAVETAGLGKGRVKYHNYDDFFMDAIYEYKTFNNDLRFDKESFIGRNLSTSYAPTEEEHPEKYHGLIAELSELFDEYSVNGILNYPHFTQSHIGKV
jgi:Methylase involved in ubiquinone/menaquinone biosynthesis